MLLAVLLVAGCPSPDDRSATASRGTRAVGDDAVSTTSQPGSTTLTRLVTSIVQPDAPASETSPTTAAATPPVEPPATPASVVADPPTTSTSAPASERYDFVAPLPPGCCERGHPFRPSLPYQLAGDTTTPHGRGAPLLMEDHGCVWLVDGGGRVLSVVWPERWSVRFVSDGQTATIHVLDELGREQANNTGSVGIVGGETNREPEFCHVSELVYEVARIGNGTD